MASEANAELILSLEADPYSPKSTDALQSLYGALDIAGARWLATQAAVPPMRAAVLFRIACFFPYALVGMHGRLLDDGVLTEFRWPYAADFGAMFAGADTATRDRLIALARGSSDQRLVANARNALAWIDDDVAAAALAGGDDWWHLLSAGWERPDGGERRRLTVRDRCRRLVRDADPSSPVVVIDDHGGSCGWCAGPLAVLVDLDLSHPDLAFLGIVGRRLRVSTCEGCTCYAPIFTDVDLDGRSRWSAHNARPADIGGGPYGYSPRRQLGLGSFRRTPYEAMAFGHHMSQVGGQASWIQPPAFPVCPSCDRRMPFLAQVDGEEFPNTEGMLYAFVDLNCMTAATSYQQT